MAMNWKINEKIIKLERIFYKTKDLERNLGKTTNKSMLI